MTMRFRLAARCVAAVFVLLATNYLAADDAPPAPGDNIHPRFVSVGQLASTRSKSGKPAGYVLLDERGEILNRLQPTPEVDLARYLGQEVGVTARTLVDGAVPILLAERVTPFGAAATPVTPQIVATVSPSEIALTSHEEALLTARPNVLVSQAPSVVESIPVPMGEPVSSVIGEPFAYGSPIASGDYLDGYQVGGACGGDCGNRNCDSCVPCPCGPVGAMWIRAEYLLWWTKGMDVPPLVTTSPQGVDREDAGVLGQPGTSILYGGDEYLNDSRSGGRIIFGKWCDQCQWIGFETEFLFLGDQSDSYDNCNLGQQILARPFFNSVRQAQDSELVQFPGVLVGAIAADVDTEFWGIAPRFRINLACESLGGDCLDCRDAGSYRFDMLLGYRYLSLEDGLRVRERLSTLSPTDQTVFDLQDSFDSSNDFNGFDLGIVWEGYRGPWSLELIGRCALGNTRQKVNINGSTTTTGGGASFTDPGGLLALSSNIGEYSRNRFAVVPEFGATLGYAIGPRTRLTAGYTFLYWNNVVRAAEQVDFNVNPDLLPPPLPDTGPQTPAFAFNDTSYWAQGLNLGFDYRW